MLEPSTFFFQLDTISGDVVENILRYIELARKNNENKTSSAGDKIHMYRFSIT